jgi:predicted TIM-barrel fold metal-dependent hydrolase
VGAATLRLHSKAERAVARDLTFPAEATQHHRDHRQASAVGWRTASAAAFPVLPDVHHIGLWPALALHAVAAAGQRGHLDLRSDGRVGLPAAKTACGTRWTRGCGARQARRSASMRIDYHTHAGLAEHYAQDFLTETARMRKEPLRMAVDPAEHDRVTAGYDKVIVLAFRSLHLGLNVTNEYVAEFVRARPQKYIGFASVDPHERDAVEQLRFAHQRLGLRGVKMSPIYQAFHPMDERVLPIYAYAEQHGLPILIHQGTTFPRRAPLKYASPLLLEDVCLAFPDLRFIIAHLGQPWFEDTISVMRKHPHLYADISGLHYRPWQFYNALMLFHEYGLLSRLVFGSDYPIATPQETLTGLRNVNQFTVGNSLPRIPEEEIDRLVDRNLLAELNLG